jgi:hypothetical protein
VVKKRISAMTERSQRKQMGEKTEYIVLCGQVVGSGPFTVEYGFDGERFGDRADAIRHGYKIRGSDDFNIGTLKDGKLTKFGFMHKNQKVSENKLCEIAHHIQVSP